MLVKRINRASAEQVFIVVKNSASATMSLGHGVVWDYQTNTTAASGYATGDGYSVKFAGNYTAATTAVHVGRFAGIVAGRDIQAGDYGSVQVYGQHDSVYVQNINSAPYDGGPGTAAWNDTKNETVILRPLGLYGNSTPAQTNAGYLGVLTRVTTIAGTQTYVSTDVNLDLRPLWDGPYVIPCGLPMSAGVSTTMTSNASYATASTAYFKAFIKCL